LKEALGAVGDLWYRLLFLILPVVMLIKDRVVDLEIVTGNSMAPTLNGTGWLTRDVVLVFKDWALAYALDESKSGLGNTSPTATPMSEIGVGSCVVFLNPLSETVHRVIKRVTAIRPISEEKNVFYMEGDNKELSVDSRLFGEVNESLIEGKAVAVVWPPWRTKWL
jgi:signal peptidase I